MLYITIEALVKIAVLIAGVMGAAAYLVLVERWMAAWVQDRLGPNRVGVPLTKIRLFGLGQPIADGGKLFFKAEYTPGHVDKIAYILAPLVVFVFALVAFAIVPFGSILPPAWLASWGIKEPIHFIVAPGVDAALIYFLVVGGVAVIGVVLGGWASNNKYSLFGSLRSAAQLLSYELPLGLALLGVALIGGSLRLDRLILAQAEAGVWNVFVQPLGFVVFCVAAFAEATRLPFDLPESEQELVGGYHTEYFGVKLMLFLVSEYLHMIAAAFLMVILFLGGWHFWGLTGSGEAVPWYLALLRLIVLVGKVGAVILFFMLVRWTWLRFRYDQLMGLGWKVMIPLGVINLLATAVWLEFGREAALRWGWPPALSMAVWGWLTFFVSAAVFLLWDPIAEDNRPLRGNSLSMNKLGC